MMVAFSFRQSLAGSPRRVVSMFALISMLWGCAASSSQHASVASPKTGKDAVGAVLDDWHRAASEADEERYFGHFHPEGVFLGTDATERWDVEAFRAYAHPHFAKGKAWSFVATRRAIVIRGGAAWFDEDLRTPNLGPARGSGVLLKVGEHWRIAHYNLTITVPNERFKEVRDLLKSPASSETKP